MMLRLRWRSLQYLLLLLYTILPAEPASAFRTPSMDPANSQLSPPLSFALADSDDAEGAFSAQRRARVSVTVPLKPSSERHENTERALSSGNAKPSSARTVEGSSERSSSEQEAPAPSEESSLARQESADSPVTTPTTTRSEGAESELVHPPQALTSNEPSDEELAALPAITVPFKSSQPLARAEAVSAEEVADMSFEQDTIRLAQSFVHLARAKQQYEHSHAALEEAESSRGTLRSINQQRTDALTRAQTVYAQLKAQRAALAAKIAALQSQESASGQENSGVWRNVALASLKKTLSDVEDLLYSQIYLVKSAYSAVEEGEAAAEQSESSLLQTRNADYKAADLVAIAEGEVKQMRLHVAHDKALKEVRELELDKALERAQLAEVTRKKEAEEKLAEAQGVADAYLHAVSEAVRNQEQAITSKASVVQSLLTQLSGLETKQSLAHRAGTAPLLHRLQSAVNRDQDQLLSLQETKEITLKQLEEAEKADAIAREAYQMSEATLSAAEASYAEQRAEREQQLRPVVEAKQLLDEESEAAGTYFSELSSSLNEMSVPKEFSMELQSAEALRRVLYMELVLPIPAKPSLNEESPAAESGGAEEAAAATKVSSQPHRSEQSEGSAGEESSEESTWGTLDWSNYRSVDAD